MAGEEKIEALFQEAMSNPVLRYRLYYCPEQVADSGDFDADQKNALLFGDFSRIALSDEMRSMAHKIFNEAPFAGDMPPETAAVNVFTMKSKNDPCV